MFNTGDGILPRLLEQNARWLATMALQHPGVIEEAAREQKPTVSRGHYAFVLELTRVPGPVDWLRGLSCPGVRHPRLHAGRNIHPPQHRPVGVTSLPWLLICAILTRLYQPSAP